jgi:ATP synthase protein I
MFLGVRSRPIRTTLRWQLIVSAALAVVGGFIWGMHGAVSAALGGLVNVAAGWAYGWLVTRRTRQSAGQALATMFRAEAVKVALIVALIWLSIANYKDLVVASFLIAFVITVLVSATAIVVKDA